MPTPPSILNKVKLLLKLTASPNTHEADSAQQLANKLIEKHNITHEELESIKDPKEFYGEDEKLFVTIGIVGWMQQLALAIGNHFDCQIVQEELVPPDGPHPFHYYVYGDPKDVKLVQLAFNSFVKQVDKLVDTNCFMRGPIYIESYSEGVVSAIKGSICLYGIKIVENSEATTSLNPEAIITKSEELVKPKEEKPQPTDKRSDISANSMIKDIAAYFTGVYDGRELFLQETKELE